MRRATLTGRLRRADSTRHASAFAVARRTSRVSILAPEPAGRPLATAPPTCASRRYGSLAAGRQPGPGLAAVAGLTVGSLVLAVALAPDGSGPPGRPLQWVLFVGSSVHVASSGWFAGSAPVRRFAARHRRRFVVVPVTLVLGTALVAGLLTEEQFTLPLLAFLAWQLFHYAKQNLGMSALAARAEGAAALTARERQALVAAACGGIAGLIAHPELLGRPADALGPVSSGARALFPVAGACFVVAAGFGVLLLGRRSRADRPVGFLVVHLSSLLFFAPAFCFASPYRAVAGMTVVHGLQYLLMMALVAAGQGTGRSRAVSGALLVRSP